VFLGQKDGTWHFRTTFLPPEAQIEAVAKRMKVVKKEKKRRREERRREERGEEEEKASYAGVP